MGLAAGNGIVLKRAAAAHSAHYSITVTPATHPVVRWNALTVIEWVRFGWKSTLSSDILTALRLYKKDYSL